MSAEKRIEDIWQRHLRAVYGRDAARRSRLTCSPRSARTFASARGATASFLLESVEQGRLGPPLVHRLRLAARHLRGGGEPRRAGRRLPRLRPRGEARADGSSPRRRRRASGEPVRRRRHARPLRPRQRHGRRARRRPGRDRDEARERRLCYRNTISPRGTECGATPTRRTYEDGVRRIKELIRAGDAFQVVLSQRAERTTSASARRALPCAPPRQPLAVPLPARARGARADRLLARDAGQVRGRDGEPEPDRRYDRAGRGRRRAAAHLREGPRRARDARRPRPQRSLASVRGRQRPGGALPRAGALLARHAPRLRGHRRAP